MQVNPRQATSTVRTEVTTAPRSQLGLGKSLLNAFAAAKRHTGQAMHRIAEDIGWLLGVPRGVRGELSKATRRPLSEREFAMARALVADPAQRANIKATIDTARQADLEASLLALPKGSVVHLVSENPRRASTTCFVQGLPKGHATDDREFSPSEGAPGGREILQGLMFAAMHDGRVHATIIDDKLVKIGPEELEQHGAHAPRAVLLAHAASKSRAEILQQALDAATRG